MDAGPLKIGLTDVTDEIVLAIKSFSLPVAKAATAAIKDAAAILKTSARAHIASAGFGKRWQNAYRVTVYPQKGVSIDAAALGLFKGIPFSDIFSLGGTIRGHPLLWLPFSTTPKIDKRKSAADIADYARRGIKLFSINVPGKRPMLAVNVRMSRSQARRGIVRVTLGQIEAGEKPTRSKRQNSLGLVNRAVPLFFGIDSVTIRKRFNFEPVRVSVENQLPALYEAHLNPDEDR